MASCLKRWLKWEKALPLEVNIPLAVEEHQQLIKYLDLHGFGNANTRGVAAVFYSVIRQKMVLHNALSHLRVDWLNRAS